MNKFYVITALVLTLVIGLCVYGRHRVVYDMLGVYTAVDSVSIEGFEIYNSLCGASLNYNIRFINYTAPVHKTVGMSQMATVSELVVLGRFDIMSLNSYYEMRSYIP
jgi:hypothetical protein